MLISRVVCQSKDEKWELISSSDPSFSNYQYLRSNLRDIINSKMHWSEIQFPTLPIQCLSNNRQVYPYIKYLVSVCIADLVKTWWEEKHEKNGKHLAEYRISTLLNWKLEGSLTWTKKWDLSRIHDSNYHYISLATKCWTWNQVFF